jgi:hypothetical protein
MIPHRRGDKTLSPFSKPDPAFRRGLLLFLALCAGCAGLHSPRTALDAARQHDPTVQWDAKSLLEADFDQDGRADYALIGLRKDRVVVGIVRGPLVPGTPVWTLEFPVKGGGEDALCSADAKIAVEPLGDEAKTRRGGGGQGVGLNLHDDKCDAFHIFWNPEKKKFEWWRL